MKRFCGLWALGLSLHAWAGTFGVGDVAIVEDTSGTIHANVDLTNPTFGLMAPGGRFCRDTANPFIQVFGDNYDGIFTFTPKMLDDLTNVQQGQPVRWTDQGIGENAFDWGSQFGSAAKLSQCVFMGSLPKLPAQPDGPVQVFSVAPLGITGTELMGHEYGHHWLNWTLFDLNQGLGTEDLLRGFDNSSCQEDSMCNGSLNGHYAYYVDSHSVMYGNFLTDNGNGTFSVTGGNRKYGELDQYLMGLRAPSEVSPVMALDDGTHHGSPAGAHANDGTSDTVSGMTRVDVSVDDIIRVLGPRSPAYPNAQSCWRVAFVLVIPPGETYVPADVTKVDAYRKRFMDWFTWATDGRGTMDARLNGNGCLVNTVPDAGVVVMPPDDAGTMTPPDMDAGNPIMETNPGDDAGMMMTPPPPVDAGMNMPMPMTTVPPPDDIAKLKPHCGCGSGLEGPGLLAFLTLLHRRRRSQSR
jgi:hypothetical protein